MTENAEKIAKLAFEYPEEVLKVLLTTPDAFDKLEDISIQAHFYQGISPRLCKDPDIMTMGNLMQLQTHCRKLQSQRSGEFLGEITDKLCFLLNENIPLEEVLALDLNKLEQVVKEISPSH